MFLKEEVATEETKPWDGVEVPIPTLPFARIEKSEEPEDDATSNGLVEPLPRTVRVAPGVVVPIPTFTASVDVPPSMIALDIPTRAFLPIAQALVRADVEATDSAREAW